MDITQKAFNIIKIGSLSQTVEIGGILGRNKSGVIVAVVLDQPSKSNGSRFEYYPNIDYLNVEIEKWSQKEIVFSGIFHTHFASSTFLSIGDKNYIKKIMKSSVGITSFLYFPIYTLPDQTFTVYKAFFRNNKLFVIQDALNIIEGYEHSSLDGCCNKIKYGGY